MKDIVGHVKDLRETSEHDIRVVEVRRAHTHGCPIDAALWREYRDRNPEGLPLPPVATESCSDPALAEYLNHVRGRGNCNNR
jgi:hypothetical protein